MRMTLIFIGLVLGLFFASHAASAFEVTGLATPESFIVDPATGNYYISNINGAPTERDNNGFITKLDADGKVTMLKFIEGGRDGATLHAPKGLDVIGDHLFVSDLDVVRVFDKKTGRLVGGTELASMGALFLNDLTHDEQGNLYVSDTTVFVNDKTPAAIFKIETRNRHKASVFVRDAALGPPNGLVIHPKTQRLLADTWGAGRIVEIGPDGTFKTLVEDAAWKDLDGLDFDGAGNLYAASFTGGAIYKIAPDRKVTVVKSGLTTPADINLDRAGGMILVPSFNGNTAMTIPIGK